MRVERVAESLRERVIGKLRHGIETGMFAPGERLVERRMCELLGVSRTLVREALRQLEAEGWVRIIPNRGPIVATFSAEEILELYEVRAALEGVAAWRAAERATPEDLAQLTQCVRLMTAAQKQNDQAVHRSQVQVFYDILRKVAGNRTLQTQLEAMSARMAWLRGLTLAMPQRAGVAVKEEAALLKALKARDAAAARTLCETHIKRAGQAAVAALASKEPGEG